MTQRYKPTLRDRLAATHNQPALPSPITIPVKGVIPPEDVMNIQAMAIDARGGDVQAREALYLTLKHRLERMGNVLRPWPNTPGQIGIWDWDDVNQEGWLVFIDLLNAWDPGVPFVKYLFARYPWRVRDRILRGIGKRLPPLGDVRVSEYELASAAYASDDEQPESAMLATRLLEEMINSGAIGGELTALKSPDWRMGKASAGPDRADRRTKTA